MFYGQYSHFKIILFKNNFYEKENRIILLCVSYLNKPVKALITPFFKIQAINCSLVGVEDLTENWEKIKSSYAKYFSDSQYSVQIVKPGKVCQVKALLLVRDSLEFYHNLCLGQIFFLR